VDTDVDDVPDLSHLHASAQRIARLPSEERLRHVRTDHWIGYRRATEALQRLETVFAWPVKQRMPNLLLIGPTNNGKSMIIEKFRRTHPPLSHPGQEQIPVLAVQMPSEPSVLRFYIALLAAMGAPLRPRQRLAELEQVALTLLRQIGVRVLVIDELYNVLAGRGHTRREFLNLIRFLGNELRIPLVGVGTREAYLAIRSDDQLENRFEAAHPAPMGTRRAGLFTAGQLRRGAAVAPSLGHCHRGYGPLPADPQRRHDRRAHPPTDRCGRRGDRVRRGVDQPAHPAAGSVHRPDRATPVLRARTGMSATRRWPLHPPPGPVEALSSWLDRISRLYGLSRSELLRHNLGPASTQLASTDADDLDWNPPTAVLVALAERTGVPPGRLRWMTIAGWVPWLLDTTEPSDDQAAFDTYVRQHSVLLTPSEIKRREVHRWRPWLPAQPMRRVCPTCSADPNHGTDLTAGVPIMLSCATHGCWLMPEVDVAFAALLNDPLPSEPVNSQVAALDRRTHEGMTTGVVTLPRRRVHVGVWFRLLRTLLNEVSIAPSEVGARSKNALLQTWQTIDRPVRAGLTIWRPYEHLTWSAQQAMLHAAAAALHFIENGTLTARGTLGPLLVPEPYRAAYDGDRPMVDPWKRTTEEALAAIEAARTDPDTARQLLTMNTIASRTRSSFNNERRLLIDVGIPPQFLPNHRELGRTDLT
jgi:hypothetical protein